MGTITPRVFGTNCEMGTERQLLLKNLADKLSRFKDGEPLFWHCKVWRPHVRYGIRSHLSQFEGLLSDFMSIQRFFKPNFMVSLAWMLFTFRF